MKKEFRIYFGANIGSEYRITENRFREFCHNHATPLFSGYTILKGVGYWQDEPENNYIMIIVADADEKDKVIEIAEAYKHKFDQDCVLVTTTELSGVAFV